MGVLRRLLEIVVDTTRRIDEEVDRGYDLGVWGEQMKFLHALQIQSQALIDLVLRSSSLLGHPPSTPIDAAKYLAEKNVMTRRDLEFFRKVLGFRNIVVHEYTSVDISLVDRILRSREYRRVMTLAEKIFREVSRRTGDP